MKLKTVKSSFILAAVGATATITAALNSQIDLALAGILVIVSGIAVNLAWCGETHLAKVFAAVASLWVMVTALVASNIENRDLAFTIAMVGAMIAGAIVASQVEYKTGRGF
ncbi:hypothetical protein KBI23_24690 [bacterium]|nr:hypothetical protein [bacterium]MBP9811302.1 hypothetical protein [bacterium]